MFVLSPTLFVGLVIVVVVAVVAAVEVFLLQSVVSVALLC